MTKDEKVKLLISALRFYANPNHWHSDGWGVFCCCHGDDGDQIKKIFKCSDGSINVVVDGVTGGERARRILKKCGVKIPKTWKG